MTHILAQHPDMPAAQGAPPSLPEPTPPALSVPTRKRKAKTEGDGEATGPEPRRLRRSHEACARCRSKKIKVYLSLFVSIALSDSSISAIQSTQNVVPVQTLEPSAIKKTVIDKLSPPAGTLKLWKDV